MRTRIYLLLLVLGMGAAALRAKSSPPQQANDSCVRCHAQLDGPLAEPAKQFASDVHATRGLSCASCHGGNPNEDDMMKSMDRAKGFRGKPKRTQIPELCAKCHSDGAFMRAYNPTLRTDQLAQYKTSVHGKRIAAGDERAAVCTDCHSVHSIQPASSPLSSVYPAQVPATCGRCHADAERMKPYKLPTNQLAEYRGSVHFEKLTGGDISAPTCATCHGNHGATPPGVSSVERVCGTCHVFQEQLFDTSPHKKPWEVMKLPSCITCHSNHRVQHTSDELIGTGEKSLCVQCHAAGDGGWKNAEDIHRALTQLDSALQQASSVLDKAERTGMEVGEARVKLATGREDLIKARVDVHTMNAMRVVGTTGAGMDIAKQTEAAGYQALAENAFRRKGLALSLIVIAFVVICLWLLIRQIERRQTNEKEPAASR